MTNDVIGTMLAGRLEFQALLSRPARLQDPADEPAADEPAPAAGAAEPVTVEAIAGSWTGELYSPLVLPASWTAASAAVQLPAGKPSRRKRSTVARRQPLAPLAPLTAQDGF